MTTTTKTPAEQYAEGLQEAFNRSAYANLGYTFYADKPGRNYTRIVENTGAQRIVHAFVENATGHVFKADSWRRPAKGVRFLSVADALDAMGDQMVHTGYLYR